jgi:hypothetical protein
MKVSLSLLVIAALVLSALSSPVPSTVGFEIGQVAGYKLLNQSGSSKLY